MARITIEKYAGYAAEYWTNVYWTSGTIGDAGAVAAALVNAEQDVLFSSVTITKLRIDDGLPNTDQFATVIINEAGTRTTSGDPMPLFVVARVDFTISGQGRPGRKYLRGFMTEADSNGLAVSSGALTLLNTYAAAVVAAGVSDPDGQAITAGAAWTQVAMRQLRRGSKKKVTP